MSTATESTHRLASVPAAAATSAATRAGLPLVTLRVLLGFVFLWAFLDKLFGLGRATPRERAWLNGGSPTTGFLSHVEGPLAGIFNGLAGQVWVDWAFMLGMVLVGMALILGAGLRLATVGAVTLMLPLYLASLPLENNPLVDEHLVYAAAAVALAAGNAGSRLGLARWWRATPVVRRLTWLG